MRLHFETMLHAPPEAVFAFHANPANLAMLMRHDPTFRLLRHDAAITPGSETWLEQRVGPLPVVLGFRHHHYDPPHVYTESLIHGPFKRFDHTHRFIPRPQGCLVKDELEFELPAWLGGEWILRRLIAQKFQKSFLGRHRAYRQLDTSDEFASSGVTEAWPSRPICSS